MYEKLTGKTVSYCRYGCYRAAKTTQDIDNAMFGYAITEIDVVYYGLRTDGILILI
jgi:hypothetical protein